MRDYTGDKDFKFHPHANLEFHIEQGPVLDKLQIPVAAVPSLKGNSQTEITITANEGIPSDNIMIVVSELVKFVNEYAANDPEALQRGTVGRINLKNETAGSEGTYVLTFTGAAAHAGNFPMPDRRDAGHAAALFNGVAIEEGARIVNMVLSPGAVNVVPGAATVTLIIPAEKASTLLDAANALAQARGMDIKITSIPNKVTEAIITTDMRNDSVAAIQISKDALRAEKERLSEKYGVRITTKQLRDTRPTLFHEKLVEYVNEAVAEVTKGKSILCPLGAGHDAARVNEAGIPTAMLACRNINGYSHRPDEDAPPEALEQGVQVLANTAYRLAIMVGPL